MKLSKLKIGKKARAGLVIAFLIIYFSKITTNDIFTFLTFIS